MPHEPSAGERAPERVLADFLEEGVGTSGAERIAAVRHLADALGFPSRLLAGVRRLEGKESPHAALLFDLAPGPAVADPAFPLPGLVPVGARGLKSAWGTLDLAARGARLVLTLDGRGLLEDAFDLAPAGDEALDALPAGEALVRLLDDRVALFREGLLTVLDPWSTLTHPLAEPDAAARLFGAAPPAIAARQDAPVLAVFDRAAAPRAALLERLRTPEGLASLAPPGLAPEHVVLDERGWTWTLGGRQERVTPAEDGVLVEVLSGEGPLASRRYAVQATESGTRLSLRAILRPLPPRGLAEPTRKTLVFHLVSELLAWQE